jgi:hypothetical protein
MVSALECMQQSWLGDVVLAMFIVCAAEFLIIVILIWVLRNSFRKTSEVRNGQSSVVSSH